MNTLEVLGILAKRLELLSEQVELLEQRIRLLERENRYSLGSEEINHYNQQDLFR